MGLLSWFLWWLGVAKKRNLSNHNFNMPTLANRTVFAFLGTPAHKDSLETICGEIDPNSTTKLSSPGQKVSEVQWVTVPDSSRNFCDALVVLFKTMRGLIITILGMRRIGKRTKWQDWSRISERIYECQNAQLWLSDLDVPSKPLFTTYELLPWQKALAWHWKKHGRRVIHVMHGQRLDLYQHTQATDLVLFSKIDEPWFRERVDSSVHIWTVGHPRLESIRKEVGPLQKTSVRLPRIAFFSQPVEGDYLRDIRLADWRLLADLKGRAEVRFRAHPRESIDQIKADMSEADIDFAGISEAGLVQDLRWCDAVASSWSTVSMEAAACGRGVFWTCSTPERYEASQELRDHGIGVLIAKAEDWWTYLDQYQTTGWKSPILVPDDKLKELGMIGEMDKPWTERLNLD